MRCVFNFCVLATGCLTNLLLVACVSVADAPEPARLAVGMPVAGIIGSHGKPYSIAEGEDLHTYVWRFSEARLADDQRLPRATVTGSGVVTYGHSMPRIVLIRCVLTARVSLEGRLIDWLADGDGCRQILYRRL